jgi:capsular exopolysaccharide synthesis family protein
MPNNDIFPESGLEVIAGALRRHALLAIACVILVPVVAYGLSTREKTGYSAAATLLFGDTSLPTGVLGTASGSGSASVLESTTDAQLISLGIVQEKTELVLARRLGPNYRPATISVSAGSQSNLATITTTSSSPRVAAETANTYATQYITMRKKASQEHLQSARQAIQSELNRLPVGSKATAEARTLRTAEQEIATLAALQTGGAQLVQPASIPASPNATHRSRNVTLGILIGLVLAVTAALVVDRLDRRMRGPRDIQDLLPWLVLGAVPVSRSLRRRPFESLDSASPAEAFRSIRANLKYLAVTHDVSSMAIASIEQGDGASTLGYQLAIIAATQETRVLYVESDLRSSSRAVREESEVHGDLAQVLSGEVALASAIHHVKHASTSGSPAIEIDVLPAPRLPPSNPVELLESPAMNEVARYAKDNYDFAIFDIAPLANVTDAYPVITRVDGVILVARVGHTARLSAAQIRQRLEDLGVRVLGVIINGADAKELGVVSRANAAIHRDSDVAAAVPVEQGPAV